MPHAAGVTTLSTSLDPAKPTMAKQLKQAGYKTAVFGKMHFNRPGQPGLYGFDEMLTEREINQAWPRAASRPVKPADSDQETPVAAIQGPGADMVERGQSALSSRPAGHAQRLSAPARRRISEQQNRDGSLALWVSFMEPHSPFDFPIGGREVRGRRNSKLPRSVTEDAWQIPLIFRDLSDEDKQGITAAYYNSVRYLDQNIGTIIELLKRHRRYENTMIVYMADHGYCLGHHGRFEKHCGYDPALARPAHHALARPNTAGRGARPD